MSNITKRFLKSTIKDGEVFDEATNHKFVQVDSDVVEMKFCPVCRQWLPVSSYNKSNVRPDGLVRKCRDCSSKFYADKIPHSATTSVRHTDVPKSEGVLRLTNLLGDVNDALNKLTEGYEGRIASLEKENEVLKEAAKGAKDLGCLTDRDIEYVLKHNQVKPRYLFEAIQRIDSRYSFTCFDSVSGLTMPVVSDFSK